MLEIIVILLMKLICLQLVSSKDCETECSNLVEPVCGKVTERDGTESVDWYHNVCFLHNMKCELEHDAFVQRVPDKACGGEDSTSRRIFDFSIVGAHQACNHSCPTYCIDTYQPVCAVIYYWQGTVKKQEKRTMVNHCHVDLFSCSVGVNVTITPMNKCFENAQGLQFMASMAALKSLGFLNEGHRRTSVLDIYQLPEDLGLQPYSGANGARKEPESIVTGFLRRMLSSLVKQFTRR